MGTLLLRDGWDVAGAGPSRLLLGAPLVVRGWLAHLPYLRIKVVSKCFLIESLPFCSKEIQLV